MALPTTRELLFDATDVLRLNEAGVLRTTVGALGDALAATGAVGTGAGVLGVLGAVSRMTGDAAGAGAGAAT